MAMDNITQRTTRDISNDFKKLLKKQQLLTKLEVQMKKTQEDIMLIEKNLSHAFLQNASDVLEQEADMAKSSFHIQKAKLFAFPHNDRSVISSYAIDTPNNNECNRSAQDALDYYQVLLDEAISNYRRRTKQHIQVASDKLIWEAVVNLEVHHTLKDVMKLVRILENKYHWQECQVALHRDEGYICEYTGKKVYNYHAHIVFFMLNTDGIYCFKSRDFSKNEMSEIQTLVADVLKMERGQSALLTKKVRFNHTQYRQVQKEKEDLELDKLQLQGENEMLIDLALTEHEKYLQSCEIEKHLESSLLVEQKAHQELKDKYDALLKIHMKKKKPELTIISTL